MKILLANAWGWRKPDTFAVTTPNFRKRNITINFAPDFPLRPPWTYFKPIPVTIIWLRIDNGTKTNLNTSGRVCGWNFRTWLWADTAVNEISDLQVHETSDLQVHEIEIWKQFIYQVTDDPQIDCGRNFRWLWADTAVNHEVSDLQVFELNDFNLLNTWTNSSKNAA